MISSHVSQQRRTDIEICPYKIIADLDLNVKSARKRARLYRRDAGFPASHIEKLRRTPPTKGHAKH